MTYNSISAILFTFFSVASMVFASQTEVVTIPILLPSFDEGRLCYGLPEHITTSKQLFNIDMMEHEPFLLFTARLGQHIKTDVYRNCFLEKEKTLPGFPLKIFKGKKKGDVLLAVQKRKERNKKIDFNFILTLDLPDSVIEQQLHYFYQHPRYYSEESYLLNRKILENRNGHINHGPHGYFIEIPVSIDDESYFFYANETMVKCCTGGFKIDCEKNTPFITLKEVLGISYINRYSGVDNQVLAKESIKFLDTIWAWPLTIFTNKKQGEVLLFLNNENRVLSFVFNSNQDFNEIYNKLMPSFYENPIHYPTATRELLDNRILRKTFWGKLTHGPEGYPAKCKSNDKKTFILNNKYYIGLTLLFLVISFAWYKFIPHHYLADISKTMSN